MHVIIEAAHIDVSSTAVRTQTSLSTPMIYISFDNPFRNRRNIEKVKAKTAGVSNQRLC